MAIDDRTKRASVPGVGRPAMRGKFPGTINEGWRHGTGLSYAGTVLSPVAAAGQLLSIRHIKNFNRELKGGMR